MSQVNGNVRTVIPKRDLNPELCRTRGHCGPFANAAVYSRMPGWEGFGDCLVCGSTVRIAPTPQPVRTAAPPRR
jgi:hypothetical protein